MKILLATDGSECAGIALDFLGRFPFPDKSEVTLMTVLDKEVFKFRKKSEMTSKQKERLQKSKKQLREAGEEFLQEEAAKLSALGRKTETLVRSGHPAEEIVLAAKELSADLVVMGSHGLRGIERFLLGSVSNHVLRHAPCSVLITKHRGEAAPLSDPGPLRILLAFDGSKHSKRAVEFMADMPLPESTRIKVLTVLPTIKMFRQDVKQKMTWVWQEKKLLAEKSLYNIAHEVRWGHPEIVTELREGEDVSQELLKTAGAENADLVVLGYKGKGAIDRFLLGSVTTRIAQHSDCSILAVRIHDGG